MLANFAHRRLLYRLRHPRKPITEALKRNNIMRMAPLLALAAWLLPCLAWSQFSLPLKHLKVTSGFGNRIHPVTGCYAFHAGIDLRSHKDTVLSVLDGRVENTGFDALLGIFITIKSGPFLITYGHLSQCFVNKGDSLTAASPLGISGASGRVTGEHLHFAVQLFQRYIDPLTFLTAAEKITNH